jgi:acetyltransferase-like isoleucine patch superfamily enzyme
MDSQVHARGRLWKRIRSVIFLLPAWFSPHAKLRAFFHRLRGVRLGKNVEVGYFCIIGNVHPHLITIEDGAVITTGVVILEHDNAYYYTRGGQVKYGPVVIKERAFIGLHSVIMPNVTVGQRSIVGANSLVLGDVPADTVVGGLPARYIKDNV